MITYEVLQEQKEPVRSVARSVTGEAKKVHLGPDRKINCQMEFPEILFRRRGTERNVRRKASLASDKRLRRMPSHGGVIYR